MRMNRVIGSVGTLALMLSALTECVAGEDAENPVGAPVIYDVTSAPKATPRQSLAFKVFTKVNKNLFWDTTPMVQCAVENHGNAVAAGVRCDLRVEDGYYQRDTGSARIEFPSVARAKGAVVSCRLRVPYGVFHVHWVFADGEGKLAGGTIDVAKMLPPCYRDAPESVRAYERRWGLFGGVWGFYAPELASDMGTRWVRYEDTVWSGYEKERGKYQMADLPKRLKRYTDAGVEPIILQTLYQRPEFHNPDRPDFAPAYGQVMKQTALAARDLAGGFELGNEDNGPTKMIYAEVARQAAAGIRSVRPQALIANSGTAYVDVGWLRMQAARGLFDVLDVLCTHPYTSDSSPEAFRVFEQLAGVDDLIDELGGMRIQWTTEFGWHHDFNQQRRAEWIPRHHIIGAAAGIDRHGLYTWERDFGVFQGTAQPAAASVHALMKRIEGHRFAGLLSRTSDLWAVVFERAGTPLAVAWSPTGKAAWSVEVGPDARVLDLFGNPMKVQSQSGRVTVELGGAPIYVTGVAQTALAAAVRNQCERERQRLAKCLKAAGFPSGNRWEQLVANPHTTGNDLRGALLDWVPLTRPIAKKEQAVIAQALRWYWAAGRMADVVPLKVPVQNLDLQRQWIREMLAVSISDDMDIPSLRYLAERCDRLADEHRIARELGSRTYADRLATMQEVFASVCQGLVVGGERVLFSLWPYLYTVTADGTLKETLRFVPGQATTARIRISSYSGSDHRTKASLRLPTGWRTEPAYLSFDVRAGKAAEGEIKIHCPSDAPATKPVILCVLNAERLPERMVPFDDVVMEAPLQLTIAPVQGLLPQTPMHATISNSTASPLSGLLRLMRNDDTRALARLRFSDLTASKPISAELGLRSVPPRPYHDWPLVAEFILSDGRRVERMMDVDFACAVRAASPPTIDGDLGEWRYATPLRLNREEFGKGSYGGQWSPTDLSATTYIMWDELCLYFAAEVTDQTFNQNLTGTSQWMQDSVQFALARDTQSPRTEIGLALTPKGDEVVRYTTPTPEVPGARLKVRVRQGGATYEAAIPWKAFAGLETPRAGSALRYAVLVNDDDAILSRRFLERYGGIAHDKNIENFGHLTLLPDDGSQVEPAEPDVPVFVEDFEEYDEDKAPDAWEQVVHLPPIPDSKVVAGKGRNGSKALVLVNADRGTPHVYKLLIRPLADVRPNETYELRCWMRGRCVEASAGVIGVCSDKYGNESFSYLDNRQIADEWKEFTLRFDGPTGGRLNLIVRNASKTDEMVIDDIRVLRVKGS